MLKKILSTLTTRISTTILSFLIVVMTARFLGAEAMGTISLIVLGVTILISLNSMVGGAGLVYLIPRNNYNILLTYSYLWTLAVPLITLGLLQVFNLFSTNPVNSFHIVMLSFIFSFSKVNLNVLISKERIGEVNIVNLAQVFVLFVFLAGGFFVFKIRETSTYIAGLYFSYALCSILSFLFLRDHLPRPDLSSAREYISKLFSYGFLIQLANLLQLLNYRISYYIIDHYLTRSVLGIYSVGVQFSEAIWILCRSFALVQFARISNTQDKDYAIRVTIQFAKVSFILTCLLVFILLVLPPAFFAFVFGGEFARVPEIIAWLSVSIISNSITNMLTNYFLAVGKHHLNSVVNVTGLALAVTGGFILIPKFGYAGAGIATSISFLAMLTISWFLFRKLTQVKLNDLLINRNDIGTLKKIIIEYSAKKRINKN
jgi:O-antigen/teichoic acid export membrane protein